MPCLTSHAVPTSLPNIRDSVNARSITPVNPTRWFLVPNSTPCSELKTSAVRRCKDRGDLSQRSSGVTTIWYDHGLIATIRVFAGSECTGEMGDHIRLSPPNFIVQGDPSTFIGSHQTCVPFHRLLVASHNLSSNFNGKTLLPDSGYSEADGG